MGREVLAVLLHRWRSVSKAVYDATVGSGEDDPWYCHLDYERPNAGCDQPDDYDAGQPEQGVAA